MKDFVISIIIFTILIICVTINVFYINKVHSDIETLLGRISPIPCKDNTVIINEIIKYWEENSVYLSISVSLKSIEDFNNTISLIAYANDSSEASILNENITTAQKTIDYILGFERFSIKNIL